MVHVNGAITSTILKARFGDDVRKSSLHHNNDLTFIDLLLNVQRIFGLQGDQNLVLKYKDHDGDLVTLASDSDLLLALNTVGSQLDVTVLVDSRAYELVSDVQRQVDQIKADVGKLLGALSTLDNLAAHVAKSTISVAPTHDNIVLQKSYEAPPSPVPSEKPELPATIDPSIQEQVDNFNHRPAHVEEEIPLEASYLPHQEIAPHADSSNSSFSQPPIENFGAIPPPTATIPSFPTSNAAIPPVQHQEFAPPPPPQQQQQQQYQAPPPPVTSHSSVSSTPIPQGPPSVYGAPPTPQQYGAPPQGPPSEVGGFAPPPTAPGPQGFAPPHPQGFQPPPPQQQFQAPPPSGGPPQGFQPPPPQGFAAPPQGFAPPPQQQGFAAPPPQGFAPPPQQQGLAPPPPQQQQQGFAPPPAASGAPGGFAPPPQGFAPPPGGPGAYGPPQGFGGPGAPPAGPPSSFGPPPTGFPPGGPQAGGNPFARGPTSGYRQSPYHQ